MIFGIITLIVVILIQTVIICRNKNKEIEDNKVHEWIVKQIEEKSKILGTIDGVLERKTKRQIDEFNEYRAQNSLTYLSRFIKGSN